MRRYAKAEDVETFLRARLAEAREERDKLRERIESLDQAYRELHMEFAALRASVEEKTAAPHPPGPPSPPKPPGPRPVGNCCGRGAC